MWQTERSAAMSVKPEKRNTDGRQGKPLTSVDAFALLTNSLKQISEIFMQKY